MTAGSGFPLKDAFVRYAFLSHFDFNLFKFRLPLMEHLASLGHEVFAICPPGDFSGRLTVNGVRWLPCYVARRSFEPVKELRSLVSIVGVLRAIRPDILHTFVAKPNIYGCLAARLLPTARVVSSVTGLGSYFLPENDSGRTRLIEILYRLALKRADRVIFQNPDDLKFFLERRLCGRAQTTLIRGSGVNTEIFRPAQRRRVPGQPLAIGMTARLSREKGVFEFVRAAEILKSEFNCRCVLIGEPDHGSPGSISEADFAALKANPALAMVGFQNDVAGCLHELDIYCLPSYREGLPMSVLEAMACGLPVITTDVPGCRETVIDGVNGFLVKAGDAAAIVAAVRKFIASPQLLTEFGRAGRSRACGEFALEKVIDRHMSLYGEL